MKAWVSLLAVTLLLSGCHERQRVAITTYDCPAASHEHRRSELRFMRVQVVALRPCAFDYLNLDDPEIVALAYDRPLKFAEGFEVRELRADEQHIVVRSRDRAALRERTIGVVVYCSVCDFAFTFGIGME